MYNYIMRTREKKHRLDRDCYKGTIQASFTICIKNRENIFTNEVIVYSFVEILKESLRKFDCKNWVYVFMPDHLHLVLEGNSEKSDLWKAIVYFKQKSGYWLSKNGYNAMWQKDFYDHIFRKEEDLKKQIRYILENPVRKELIDDWVHYKFKGSIDYDLSEILN
ncbi:MAG: transposase [candidate division WOR-3 bacterium]